MNVDLLTQFFLVVACVVFLMILPLRWRFAIVMVVSIPQLYLFPVHDTYLSLSFLAAYSLSVEAVKSPVFYARRPLFLIFIGFIVVQVISLSWSSDLRLGVRTILFELPFLFIAGAAYKIFGENKRFVLNVVGVTAIFVLIEAFFVIVFRIIPDFELVYWDSVISRLFANPNLMDAFLDGVERNNSYDQVKAGGMFVNANVAASYLLMSSYFAFIRGFFSKKWFYYVVGAILWSSVWFTGSKAGMILAIVFFPGFMFLMIRNMMVEFLKSSLVLSIGGVISIVLLFGVLESSIPKSSATQGALELSMPKSGVKVDELIEDGENNLGIRIRLWRYGMMRFIDKPLQGFGFGGWQEEYELYAIKEGLDARFPPHNTVISLWSQSGIFAVVIAMLFVLYMLYVAFCVINCDRYGLRIYGVVMLFVVGVIFVHGMVENFGLFGEERQLPILATIVGIAYAGFQNCRSEIQE